MANNLSPDLWSSWFGSTKSLSTAQTASVPPLPEEVLPEPTDVRRSPSPDCVLPAGQEKDEKEVEEPAAAAGLQQAILGGDEEGEEEAIAPPPAVTADLVSGGHSSSSSCDTRTPPTTAAPTENEGRLASRSDSEEQGEDSSQAAPCTSIVLAPRSKYQPHQQPPSSTDIIVRASSPHHSPGTVSIEEADDSDDHHHQLHHPSPTHMGQAASSRTGVFLAPPYVTDVNALVNYWTEDDNDSSVPQHHHHKLDHYTPQSHHHQQVVVSSRSARSSRASRSSHYDDDSNGATIILRQHHAAVDAAGVLISSHSSSAAACRQCGHQEGDDALITPLQQQQQQPWNGFGAPPSLTLATLTRPSSGLELVLAKDSELGMMRLPLEGLDGSEEVLIALSDRSTARLPARTLVAKAGKGEVSIELEGGNVLVYRVERAMTTMRRRRRTISSGIGKGGEEEEEQSVLAVAMPRMSERETQLATILVGLAAVHRDVTGITLILVALLIMNEGYKRRRLQQQGGGGRDWKVGRLGGGDDDGDDERYGLRDWDLELIAERCQLGAEQQRELEDLLRRRPRDGGFQERHMTYTTTTTTTTTMSSSSSSSSSSGDHHHHHHVRRDSSSHHSSASSQHHQPAQSSHHHQQQGHERHISFTSSSSSHMEEMTFHQARHHNRGRSGDMGGSSSTIRVQRSSDTMSAASVVLGETEEERLRREMEQFQDDSNAEAALEDYHRQVEQQRMEALMRAMPQRYLSISNGIREEAERRWRATIKWREEQAIDKFLDIPHPSFDLIKKCYAQYMAGRSRNGVPIYWEQTAMMDAKRLKANGIGVDQLLWHQVYICEFIYARLITNKEDKMVTVVDVAGLYMSSLPGFLGDPLDFVVKALQIVQHHYPERNEVLLVVNAPSWFSYIYNLIKHVFEDWATKRLRIVTEGQTKAALRDYMDDDQIPLEYGGTLKYGNDKHSVRFTSPFEVALRQHVEQVMEKNKQQPQGPPPTLTAFL